MSENRKKAVPILPEGFGEYCHIDLQNDKKTALLLNAAAAVLMVGLLVLGHFAFVSAEMFLVMKLLQIVVLIGGYVAYAVLHELTHAAIMKLCGAKKVRFGFTGLYAFAGSEQDYFGKSAYRLIALAPLTVWGVIFTVGLLLAPPAWFWVIYFWQVGNIAGAMGDIYVAAKTGKMPADILVKDTGIEMFVYSRQAAK